MTTDYRALCAELLSRLEESDDYILKEEGTIALADRARAALAQPEAVGPTDEELICAAEEAGFCYESYGSVFGSHYEGHDIKPEVLSYARAVLQRWGRTAITPIPVSERLPEAGDCDAEGRCWWHAPETDAKCAVWCLGPGPNCLPPEGFGETHWLPAHALPLPTTEP